MDILIFREIFYSSWPFQWTVRAPLTDVAKQLDVTDDTVRSRIRRMQESGFLRGSETVVNPSVLGLETIAVEVPAQGAETTQEALEMIPLLEGARWIFHFDTGSMRILFFQRYGPHLERVLRLVEKITDTRVQTWTLPVEPTQARLTWTDWRIIAAIRRDSRRPVNEIEQATGFPRRTVQRRLTRLMETRAIFTSPVTDLDRIGGGSLVSLRIPHEAQVDAGEVVRNVLPGQNMVASFGDENVLALAILEGPEAVHHARRQTEKAMQGHPYHFDVFRRRITCHAWLDGVIQERSALLNAE